LILGFVGIVRSTYYEHTCRNRHSDKGNKDVIHRDPTGRPIPGYSCTYDGRKVPDEQIEEWLCELISGDGFPYGYRKLTVCLHEEYLLKINHKKVYRLCKELGILRPQRRVKGRKPKKLAKKVTVEAPNQLWQMDLKYGYITGEDRFFFQLSLIDVFDRDVICYHLGRSCTAEDAVRVLERALQIRGLLHGCKMPTVRTDNGPQFIAKAFATACDQFGVLHERIPVNTPNMNAHIESFHAILEDECYSQNEFQTFLDAYTEVSKYMSYYNERRRHGSLNYQSPRQYHQAFMSNSIRRTAIVA
jgi:putative transposase